MPGTYQGRYKRAFLGVYRGLQGYFKGVSWGLQGSFEQVSGGSNGVLGGSGSIQSCSIKLLRVIDDFRLSSNAFLEAKTLSISEVSWSLRGVSRSNRTSEGGSNVSGNFNMFQGVFRAIPGSVSGHLRRILEPPENFSNAPKLFFFVIQANYQ